VFGPPNKRIVISRKWRIFARSRLESSSQAPIEFTKLQKQDKSGERSFNKKLKMAEQKNDFEGKIVLVTGGSRGIGADIVKKFASSGATVVFSYTSSAEKAKALEDEVTKTGVGQAIAVKADHSSTQESVDLVKYVGEKFGKLDVLVNNAGVAGFGKIGEEK
jgi:3-oxoacyl-ACP reductase-like protein